MWSVFSNGQTTVTCWFCNEKTRLSPSENGTTNKLDWHCDKCDNQNTVDANGNIVDSRAEMYQESPLPRRLHLAGNSGNSQRVQVFCSTCQRNQELVCQILSAYLPDEDDPEYSYRVENAEDYARSLKRRYPLVCRACQSKVDDKLQQQAQWIYRRELASALQRSERARKYAPRMQPQPTLRRKGMVVTWLVCALVGLVFSQVAMWLWYIYMCSIRPEPSMYVAGTGLVLALLTYFSRMLNPLWLYIAYHPGMRAFGLPLYKRRVSRLSLLRLVAGLLQLAGLSPRIWPVLALYDLSLCFFAAKDLRARGSLRPPSRQGSQTTATASGATQGEQLEDRDSMASTAIDTQRALSSLQSLSFGSSEVNRDQDDSFLGTEFTSGNDIRWGRRPSAFKRPGRAHSADADSSGDEGTVNTDIMSGLNSMSMGFGSPKRSTRPVVTEKMDVDLQPLLNGGMARPVGLATTTAAMPAAPRPFEPFRFKREKNTGLEMKMSSFSLDDDDDGSYQGMFGSSAMDSRLLGMPQRLEYLGIIVISGAIGFWLSGRDTPWWCFWLGRATLVAVLSTVVLTRPTRIAMPQLALIYRVATAGLLLCLVGVPAFVTLRLASTETLSQSLLRWPHDKQALINGLEHHCMRFLGFSKAGTQPFETLPTAALPQLDMAMEVVAIFVLFVLALA
ncbi:hypothetical protein IW146_005436 [Coemansia sp. RSA 922]|nr:hypothetical protein IW146_005436 [Coemansia sp. RSA 922]